MTPTLKDGDVLLVRKADLGVMIESMIHMITGGGDSRDEDTTERARLVRYELLHGVSEHAPLSRLYECPPLALTGHVVVYKSPETAFPHELCVKRVVGLGGQWLRRGILDARGRRMQSVPPYSLFVQGDNEANSRDSRQLGPISKNLMVGIAEYVVWPPTRWQRLRRKPILDEHDKPLAVWP